MPGAVLASSYVPGFKFALVLIVFVALSASVAPLVLYFQPNYDGLEQCTSNICSSLDDPSSLSSEEFLNCVGLNVNSGSIGSLCLNPVSAILPQFGLFQTMAMAIISDVIFVSEPPEYVEQVLVPSLGDAVACSGNTCVFPYTKWLYGVNIGFMTVGAFLLLILGVVQVSFFSFPGSISLRVKACFSNLFEKLRCTSLKHKGSGDEKMDEAASNQPPLEEVTNESEYVQKEVKPLLKQSDPEQVEEGTEDVEIADHDKIPRDDIDPVLMYKLRKVYPGASERILL